MDNERVGIITGCVTGVLLFVTLVGGVTSCSVLGKREATRQITVTCSGDLKADAIRAAACILATQNAKLAGQ